MKALMRSGLMLTELSFILGTAGCSVGPKYTRPNIPAPPSFRGGDDSAIASSSNEGVADKKWSEVFHEPELQDLIRQALADNYDLRIAAQRVLQQQAQVRITRSQAFPQISGGGTGVGAAIPDALGKSLGSPVTLGSFSISASWTPDFWGLYRKQTEAARAQLLAQEWAQRAVRLTLVQQVASDYFEVRALDEQLAVAKSTAKTREDSLRLTRSLARQGAAPLSDVRQAEQLVYTATAAIPLIEQEIQQKENALRYLIGQPAGAVMHVDPNALKPPPEALPTGIPSDLLTRRPDIQEAEAQLKAANALVGAARAQYFPQISLSGSGGFGGDDFSDIFVPASKTIYGVGSVTQPIFQGGRIRGQYELSKERKEELVLSYRNAINGAFRDVSDALIAVQKQRDTRRQQELLVDAAKDATRLARDRYKAGATGYLEVLTTDSALFAVQLNLISARQNEALTLVQLYSSLGGGWQ